MQLGLLVALVAAIVISENAPHEPVDAGGLRLCLALASGLGVILLAAVGSRTVARAIDRDQDRRLTWLRKFSQLKQVHLGAWLAVAGTTMFALRLAAARAVQLGTRSGHPGQGPADPGADLDALAALLGRLL